MGKSGLIALQDFRCHGDGPRQQGVVVPQIADIAVLDMLQGELVVRRHLDAPAGVDVADARILEGLDHRARVVRAGVVAHQDGQVRVVLGHHGGQRVLQGGRALARGDDDGEFHKANGSAQRPARTSRRDWQTRATCVRVRFSAEGRFTADGLMR
jgi:hypothetical protein